MGRCWSFVHACGNFSPKLKYDALRGVMCTIKVEDGKKPLIPTDEEEKHV
jgi:hypothetical protein